MELLSFNQAIHKRMVDFEEFRRKAETVTNAFVKTRENDACSHVQWNNNTRTFLICFEKRGDVIRMW